MRCWQGYEIAVISGRVNTSPTQFLNLSLAVPNNHTINSSTFNPGTASHIYRVDIKDNTFQIYVDGGLRLSVTDNTYAMGTGIGLWSNNAQLVVTSFKVTAL